jgi:hypothetical protein
MGGFLGVAAPARTFAMGRPASPADPISLSTRANQLLGRAQALAELSDLLTLLSDPLRRGQATLAAVEPACVHAVMNDLMVELAEALHEINARLVSAREEVSTETALVFGEVMALADARRDP